MLQVPVLCEVLLAAASPRLSAAARAMVVASCPPTRDSGGSDLGRDGSSTHDRHRAGKPSGSRARGDTGAHSEGHFFKLDVSEPYRLTATLKKGPPHIPHPGKILPAWGL